MSFAVNMPCHVIEHPSGKKKPYALYQAEKNGYAHEG